ncbi:Rv1733c family protein [Streptomyces aurantiogriseus]|uniref:Proline rich protein membrane protein n=1 Tax=Streptomyces aurantiogriseus TaxID=66870 RepID=A0A918FFU1_9ACTN|nr:hypothetical protein [Streptomyces aurantiogriseus]GGR35195.1 hypothetical protein GCM10010251_59310 [Streptomyces aurantiogriseus]
MARTRRGKATKVRLWRWRRNPLRRPTDVVEAWLLLGAWCLAAAAGTAAGTATAHAVEQNLDSRRAERHAVPAALTQDAPLATSEAAGAGDQVWARVRWTSADGSTRTSLARVDPGEKTGARTQVWLDRNGKLVPAPVPSAEAEFQVVALGTTTAVGAGAAVLSVGWVVRGRLDRRRMQQWDREWAQFGQQWGRRTG